MPSKRIFMIIAAMTLSISGCSRPTDLPATPEPNPSKYQLPPRPRDLQIEALDPCTTFSSEQLDILNVAAPVVDPPAKGRGLGCSWKHSPQEPVESYSVYRNTDRGLAEAFAGATGLPVIKIAEFPAIVTQGMYAPRDSSCIIGVDVASTQSLQVNYDYNGSTVPMTRELACQKARTAAELAMQTLIARAGG